MKNLTYLRTRCLSGRPVRSWNKLAVTSAGRTFRVAVSSCSVAQHTGVGRLVLVIGALRQQPCSGLSAVAVAVCRLGGRAPETVLRVCGFDHRCRVAQHPGVGRFVLVIDALRPVQQLNAAAGPTVALGGGCLWKSEFDPFKLLPLLVHSSSDLTLPVPLAVAFTASGRLPVAQPVYRY